MRSNIFRSLLVAVFAAATAVGAARAADKVVLKDGRVLEGTIVREVDGSIWLRYKLAGIEQESFFAPAAIERIERDTPENAPAEAVKPAKADVPKANFSGAPRAAIVSVGDQPDKGMVGMYVTAKALQDAIPLLEKEKIDVVVLLIDSPGGYTLEVQRLSDVIHNEYKPRFRTVAWIQSAISAAAMTTHCVEEIYFMPEGHYGACTEFSGAYVATKDRALEERLVQMERISARGNHPKEIMRAMQIMEPLSATIDNNGVVHWFQDESGDHLVNPKGRVLTFNAAQAEQFRFSKGTVRSLDELTKAMGYTELEWVGRKVAGIPWPVCEAEELQMRFRDKTHLDETSLRTYQRGYLQSIQLAQGAQQDDRAKFVNTARKWLNQIKSMVRNNPNFAIFVLGLEPGRYEPWVEEQEELLRRLMK